MDNRTFKSVVGHPSTWIVVAVVAGIQWAFLDWFEPSLSMTVASALLGAALLVSWPLLLVRSQGFLRRLYQIPEQSSAQKLLELEALESDLRKLGYGQGVEQLARLQDKLKSLTDVLERRLNAGELTYGRYLGTAQQVYLAAVDNLHSIAVALTSVGSIDRAYIATRLAELRGNGDTEDVNSREIETLEKRLLMLEEQNAKVADWFALNEEATTAITNTATALADAKTTKGHAAMDVEAAMFELERLAERAQKYAKATSP